MIQDMRKKEDDEFDEEMEAMREMENESNAVSAAKSDAVGNVPEERRQADNDLEPPENAEGTKEGEETRAERKQWKKKGQKRQTKRVISECFHCDHCAATNVPLSETGPCSTKESLRYTGPA